MSEMATGCMSLQDMARYGIAVALRAPDVVQLVGLVAGLVGGAVVFGGAGLLVGGGVLVVIGWAMRAVRASGGQR